MVLNVDGTGGQLDPEGKPQYFTWSGAEKTYADFELTVTSPGAAARGRTILIPLPSYPLRWCASAKTSSSQS